MAAYRRDIDGLRAVAVLPVVFYHLDLPGFPGGFVGVDVFFVISGYLITQLIAPDIAAGSFSIVSFYERRIRRIIPALAAVMMFCVIAGGLLWMPDDFDNLSKSLVATAAFVSNVYFWRLTGYFSPEVRSLPLLHTWSLAVEEQFYIAYPLALVVLQKYFRGRLRLWVGLFAVLSFGASAWGVTHNPAATFYLAPMRAWELLVGALLALGAVPPISSRPLREVAAIVGLCCIAGGVFMLSKETPFPGPAALLPCLGAALVIHAGASGATRAGALLGSPPLVFIGLISYSLYLWHWPLLAFGEVLGDALPGWLTTLLILATSFLCAIASWRFIERPFRNRTSPVSRPLLFSLALGTLTVMAGVGLIGHFSHGLPARLPAEVQRLVSYRKSVNPNRLECDNPVLDAIREARYCRFGADTPPHYALWGDSHALALAPGVGEAAAAHGASVELFGLKGCPPLLGVFTYDQPQCADHNEKVLEVLEADPAITTVIIAERYGLVIYGPTTDFGPAEAEVPKRPELLAPSGAALSISSSQIIFRQAFDETARRLEGMGKKIVLVYPIPEAGYDVPQTLARIAQRGGDPSQFTRPESYFEQRQQFATDVLDGLGPAGAVLRIYPVEKLCDGVNCKVMDNGEPLYSDDNHLSLAGAARLAPLFAPVFQDGPNSAVAP